jgi:hypothetical protein
LLRGEYLLRGQGRGEAQEKDAQDETAEVSGPGGTFVFPILIPHLEAPVPIVLKGIRLGRCAPAAIYFL